MDGQVYALKEELPLIVFDTFNRPPFGTDPESAVDIGEMIYVKRPQEEGSGNAREYYYIEPA